jgi:hypothetical protein
MEYETAGDPITGLKWTRKTTEKVAKELSYSGINVTSKTVGRLLRKLKFSLRVNHKKVTNSNVSPDDRNQQFEIIASLREEFANKGNPIISVDAKKKEKVGNFKNEGSAWAHINKFFAVNDHDFLTLAIGKAVPYGIIDLMLNKGWVFVGISHDTAEFSTDSIERWWRIGAKKHYSNKTHLLILADAGGSNSCRTRAWKYHLQNKLCNRHGLIVTVAHYPPGCSKWNPADRRLFSWISQNWRGVPLRTYETVLKFIRTTKTKTGLRVKSYLVRKKYKKGEKISDAQMQELDLRPNKILPQWVYTLHPANG